MEHREALVFSMHIVSTLLSRLLFLTICIFNVNIYSIYQTVCFSVLQPTHGGEEEKQKERERRVRCLIKAAVS